MPLGPHMLCESERSVHSRGQGTLKDEPPFLDFKLLFDSVDWIHLMRLRTLRNRSSTYILIWILFCSIEPTLINRAPAFRIQDFFLIPLTVWTIIWRWGWFLATSKRAAAIWASRSAMTSVTIRFRKVPSLLMLNADDWCDDHLLLLRTRLSLPDAPPLGRLPGHKKILEKVLKNDIGWRIVTGRSIGKELLLLVQQA